MYKNGSINHEKTTNRGNRGKRCNACRAASLTVYFWRAFTGRRLARIILYLFYRGILTKRAPRGALFSCLLYSDTVYNAEILRYTGI